MSLDFLRLPGAMIVTDYLLMEAILRRIGANTIRKKSNIKLQHKKKWDPWKEQIRRIRYPWTFWARANWAEGEGANLQGTVFQTALFYLVIIPRLRPGLLSLRSVLSSRQTTWQHNHQTTKQPDNKTTKQQNNQTTKQQY